MQDGAGAVVTALRDLIRLARAYNQRDAVVPLALSQVLRLLAEHGEQRLGCLAQHLVVDLSVASRHASTAEGLGLVARRTDPDDGRAILLRLTPRGRRRLAELDRDTLDRAHRALAGWSEREVATLGTLLSRLRTDLLAADAVADAPSHRTTVPAPPAPRGTPAAMAVAGP